MTTRDSIPRPIEIIGGGLAGLSLGVALRTAGIPTTLREAGTYPRHRVCGEFITGLAPATLARLGLDSLLGDARRHCEVAWFIRDRPGPTQRLPSPALGISRHTLDARLAERFVALGGTLLTGARCTDLDPRPGRVLATGRRRDAAASWVGLKVHVRDLELGRDLELHLGADGYVGLTPVHEGNVNVCGLFRLRALRLRGPALLLAYLRACGLAGVAARLERAALQPETFCAVAGVAFDRTVAPAEELRLGDAAAMIPPFTGNGMAMAFQSAEAALEPLVAYARGDCAWTEARRATAAALRRRFRWRLASARTLHPLLLHPGAQRCLAALTRARLLPFRPLYAALH